MIKQSKYPPASMLCDEFVAVGFDSEGNILSVNFEHSSDGIVMRGTTIDVTTQELERDYEMFVWCGAMTIKSRVMEYLQSNKKAPVSEIAKELEIKESQVISAVRNLQYYDDQSVRFFTVHKKTKYAELL